MESPGGRRSLVTDVTDPADPANTNLAAHKKKELECAVKERERRDAIRKARDEQNLFSSRKLDQWAYATRAPIASTVRHPKSFHPVFSNPMLLSPSKYNDIVLEVRHARSSLDSSLIGEVRINLQDMASVVCARQLIAHGEYLDVLKALDNHTLDSKVETEDEFYMRQSALEEKKRRLDNYWVRIKRDIRNRFDKTLDDALEKKKSSMTLWVQLVPVNGHHLLPPPSRNSCGSMSRGSISSEPETELGP